MLKVGDKFYKIQEKLNSFSRKKITMTDAAGVEWYRYDKPLRSYSLSEHTVTGIVRPIVEGSVGAVDDPYSRGEFTFIHCISDLHGETVYDAEQLNDYLDAAAYFFYSKKQAEEHIVALMDKDAQL